MSRLIGQRLAMRANHVGTVGSTRRSRPTMKLPQEKTDQFRRDGYLVVGPVLTTEELAEARAAYDRIFQATEKPASYRNLGQKEGEEQSKGAVIQIIDMHKLDPIFH